jgi:hypothetical protein
MRPALPWLVRWRAFGAAALQLATGRHVYYSTGCMAYQHAYCQAQSGMRGDKRPGLSKFSGAPCICRCHRVPNS